MKHVAKIMIETLRRTGQLRFVTPYGVEIRMQEASIIAYRVTVDDSVCGFWSFNGCADYIRREVSSWD